MAKIKVKVEKTATGYSAFAERYAAYTTGNSVIDLQKNMVESLNLYFEEAGNDKVITTEDILFEFELTSVFELYPVINMRALANRLSMNYTLLSQYASGKKKPSAKQTEKIVEGIRRIGEELSSLRLVVPN